MIFGKVDLRFCAIDYTVELSKKTVIFLKQVIQNKALTQTFFLSHIEPGNQIKKSSL